jgi:hypothetical protein
LAAEIGGRLGALATDGRLAYAAQHSRVVVIDPSVAAGGQAPSVSAPLGAPITALAAREGWLLAIADGLHVFALEADGLRPPLPVAHIPLRRTARSVTWMGDQAWLPSGDVLQRVDLRDPTRPVVLPTWRPEPPTDQHGGHSMRAFAPFAGGGLMLLSWNALDPNSQMIGELMWLRRGPNGELVVGARDVLSRCCPDLVAVAPTSADGAPGSGAAATDPRAVVVDTRSDAWWVELDRETDPATPHLVATPLELEGERPSASAIAWTDQGLWWAHRNTLRFFDLADPQAVHPALRLRMSTALAGPRLAVIGERLLVASETVLWWADAAPRLLAGPSVDTWPAVELALGDEAVWLRGPDGTLRWTLRANPELAHEPTGDVPEPVTDLVADADRLYVIVERTIRLLRHAAAGRLDDRGVVVPFNPEYANYDSNLPRLWDAAGDLLAANVDDDRDRVLRVDPETAAGTTIYGYHGPGPTAAVLDGERLYQLCATRDGPGCQLSTHVLADRSGGTNPAPLSLPAAPPPAATIGHSGDLVALGLGPDVVFTRIPAVPAAPPTSLGQLDLPGAVLEIALDDGPEGPGTAAWVLSEGGRHLSWIDLADPLVPRELARTSVAPDAGSLHARDGRAWLVSNGVLQAYDMPGTERPEPAPQPGRRIALPWAAKSP